MVPRRRDKKLNTVFFLKARFLYYVFFVKKKFFFCDSVPLRLWCSGSKGIFFIRVSWFSPSAPLISRRTTLWSSFFLTLCASVFGAERNFLSLAAAFLTFFDKFVYLLMCKTKKKLVTISTSKTPKDRSTQMDYLDVVFQLLTSLRALFSFLISNRCCSFCCGFWWPFSRAISSSCFCIAYEETNQLVTKWQKVLQLRSLTKPTQATTPGNTMWATLEIYY